MSKWCSKNHINKLCYLISSAQFSSVKKIKCYCLYTGNALLYYLIERGKPINNNKMNKRFFEKCHFNSIICDFSGIELSPMTDEAHLTNRRNIYFMFAWM